MTRMKAEPVVHIDDERFRVTEWRFATGAETGWHIHGHDYVIVPLTDGKLGLELRIHVNAHRACLARPFTHDNVSYVRKESSRRRSRCKIRSR